ncbi:MAG TPA: 16S rRNA (cytosine(1402)-N(4))-methyltransferase RsmH [Candidatus Paceibacterota bacterium]
MIDIIQKIKSEKMTANSTTGHIPVLLKEVVENLPIPRGGILLDGTFGGGGHSQSIAAATDGPITIVGLDRDGSALQKIRLELKSLLAKMILHKANFRNLDEVLSKEGIVEVDGILLDLGFSSDQLENSGRGFSFQKDEPLIMTLDDKPTEESLTARDIVNLWKKENLELIVRNYGEEPQARKIAEVIVAARERKSIETSGQLAEIIFQALGKRGKIHPATKTFQAIRIAVNDELGSLSETLPKAFKHLKKGGRLAVISFHSGEDRIVKQFFKSLADKKEASKITKKPIMASFEEIKENPRSRSAKLRIIEKI